MSVRRLARKRTLVTATLVTAVLTMGGLTGCGLEEPTVEKAPGSAEKGADSAEDGGEDGGEKKKEEAAGPMSAGDTAAYEGGLKVTVSGASSYTPGEFAAGHTAGNKAYQVTITLENAGEEKITADLITASARAGEAGTAAEQIFDENVGLGFQGKLLPGKKATADFVFDTPPDAGTLDVEVDLLDFATEPAQWSLTL